MTFTVFKFAITVSFYSTLVSLFNGTSQSRVKDSSVFVDDADSLRDMLVDAFTKAGANVQIFGDAESLAASYVYKGKACKGMPYKIEFSFVPQPNQVTIYSSLSFMGIAVMEAKGALRSRLLNEFLEACRDFGPIGLAEVATADGAHGLVELFRRLTSYFRTSPYVQSSRRLPQTLGAVQDDPDADYYLYNDRPVSVVPPVDNSGFVEVTGESLDEDETKVPVWALWV